jgi:hypothetical protein|tara:strand:+ start:19841 stop:20557 length:717 start_codon:yes stop_codon:yes gene_type:complete
MIISHKHRFIFVHAPKTAGTSIVDALYPFLDLQQDIILGGHPNHELQDDEEKKTAGELHKHSSALEIRERLGEEIWQNYYVFSCVRNPYSRLVSLYNWWCATGGTDTRGKQKRVKGVSFEDFLQSNRAGSLARPQVQMICESPKNIKVPLDFRNRQLVDGLFKFEELVQCFSYFCGLFNLPRIKLLKKNESLPDQKDFKFQDTYNQNSYNYVTQNFQDDLRAFDYNFPALKNNDGKCF